MCDMDSSVIEKFCNITGVSETEAEHYLEAFNGDCDEAIKAFFDSEDATHLDSPLHGEQTVEPVEDSCRHENVTPFSKSSSANKPKITTFSTLANKSDDESDERQAFYVGGSETGGGGQQVLGPPGRDRKIVPDPSQSPDVFVRNLFQAAKGKGAEVLDATKYDELKSKSSRRLPFSGAGYKLGDDPNATPQLESTASCAPSSSSVSEQNVVVKMWRDGFSLDSGPLRSYTDPEASEFFNAIQSGQIPQELLRSAGGGMVNVMLEDHHHEEWHAPPTPKVKPFAGTGQMLGFPLPQMISTEPKVTEKAEIKKSSPVSVDDSKPVTQIQIRLPDGSRIVVRLNNTHTVGDIRRAVVSERPELAYKTFSLMTSYPSRELTEDNQTLEDGSLLNSTLLIRFI